MSERETTTEVYEEREHLRADVKYERDENAKLIEANKSLTQLVEDENAKVLRLQGELEWLAQHHTREVVHAVSTLGGDMAQMSDKPEVSPRVGLIISDLEDEVERLRADNARLNDMLVNHRRATSEGKTV